MKNNLLLALTVLFTVAIIIPSNAQRSGRKSLSFSFIKPPNKPLQSSIETYFIESDVRSGVEALNNYRYNNFKLEGYKAVSIKDDAHIVFSFSSNTRNTNSSIDETTYKHKINDSTYVDRTGWYVNISREVVVDYEFRDNNTNEIIDQGQRFSKRSYKSSLFKVYNNAVKHSNNVKSSKLNDLARQGINSTMDDLEYDFNNDYGFPVKVRYGKVAQGKGKKNDYSDCLEAFKKLEIIVKDYKKASYLLTEDIKTRLDELDSFYASLVASYEKSRKAKVGDKNVTSFIYNQAYVKYMKAEYQDAITLASNKDHLKNAGKLKEIVQWSERMIELNERLENRDLASN